MSEFKSQPVIDKNSYVPIYIQLRDILQQQITGSILLPHQRIPSENELSAAYGISRMTVRQAIKELIQDGWVYVKRGEGTFVSSGPSTQMLFKLDGFSAEMSKLGFATRSEVLEAKEIRVPEKNSHAYEGLQVKPGQAIAMIKRVRYLEESPFALETSYLAPQAGLRILEQTFGPAFSIYRYVENELGIDLAKAEHIIEPRLAGQQIAGLLAIPKGSPVLMVQGTTYSDKGQPIEYLEGIYRGDKYKYRVAITK